jgi:3-deoxy-manno-octulosonate cytidylyltransferase (CMP-KDO synthetase)
MAKIAAIIPARMASTRFPGKPLAKICGLPMIEHVRRRVSLCKMLNYVSVATCDEEIYSTVVSYGGRACMTSDKHERCTYRIAEAAEKLDADIVINIQGDEPLIVPDMIEDLIKKFLSDKNHQCINLISPINSDEEFEDPNVVKTVVDREGCVLYFSRSPIPAKWKTRTNFVKFKQLGVIAFKKDILLTFAKLKPTPLEIVESVDMLRLLEHGYKIKTMISNYTTYGVDRVEDLKKVEKIMHNDLLCKRYNTNFRK